VLSLENLINDTIDVIKYLAAKYPDPTFIIVGHSMGGAIACKATKLCLED